MYLKHYMLEKKDIEEILKKGKFDEKEYTGKLLCVGWITEDVLDRYLDSNNIELEQEEIIAIQEDIKEQICIKCGNLTNRFFERYLSFYGTISSYMVCSFCTDTEYGFREIPKFSKLYMKAVKYRGKKYKKFLKEYKKFLKEHKKMLKI